MVGLLHIINKVAGLGRATFLILVMLPGTIQGQSLVPPSVVRPTLLYIWRSLTDLTAGAAAMTVSESSMGVDEGEIIVNETGLIALKVQRP